MGHVYFTSPFRDPEVFFDMPHRVPIRHGQIPTASCPELRKWLETAIKGAVYVRTRGNTPENEFVFEFENADDATLFKLTWA
jgi:hypothetical protein